MRVSRFPHCVSGRIVFIYKRRKGASDGIASASSEKSHNYNVAGTIVARAVDSVDAEGKRPMTGEEEVRQKVI